MRSYVFVLLLLIGHLLFSLDLVVCRYDDHEAEEAEDDTDWLEARCHQVHSDKHHKDFFGVEDDMDALHLTLIEGKKQFRQLWKSFEDTVGDNAAYFNVTIQGLRDRTQALSRSLSRNFRSINDLISCLASCMESSQLEVAREDSQNWMAASCNHNCIVMMEQHQHEELSQGHGHSHDDLSTFTPLTEVTEEGYLSTLTSTERTVMETEGASPRVIDTENPPVG